MPNAAAPGKPARWRGRLVMVSMKLVKLIACWRSVAADGAPGNTAIN
jgi:hypothetical protein